MYIFLLPTFTDIKKRWAITHLLEYIYAGVTVQPSGILLDPLATVLSHVAALDLTNVPVDETSDTQL